MAKVRHPQRFSEYFGLEARVLKATGAFDPVLNSDTRLFVDVLLLEGSKQPEMHDAYQDWTAHFRKIIKLLRVAKNSSDPAWRAADELLKAPEFKGTCLGYGSGSIKGSGIGNILRTRMLATARRIVELGTEDPDLFALMPILEDDFGPDRISDLTTRIIGAHLAAYTMRTLSNTRLETREFKFNDLRFLLPVNPFVKDRGNSIPVVLVPRDVMSDLPMADDWTGVADAAAKNAEYRRRVSSRVAAIWKRQSDVSKAEFKQHALASKATFDKILSAIKRGAKDAYDFDADPEGRVAWLEAGRRIAESNPLKLALGQRNIASVISVVETIIEHFKQLIEDNGIWKSLYAPSGKLMHERYAQQVFFVVADIYCRASNLDVSPETNQGGGPVDFKFSSGYSERVVVELKYSSNNKLSHGYSRQLKAYKKAARTNQGYFVILDTGKGEKQVVKTLDMQASATTAKEPHSKIVTIDVRRKQSASKL